jgi:hypothetical protein
MECMQNFGRETSSNIPTWNIEDMRDNIKIYLEEYEGGRRMELATDRVR